MIDQSSLKEMKLLPVNEKLDVVMEFWDSIAEETLPLNLTPEDEAELDRRIERRRTHPEEAVPWSEVRERISARLKQ